MQNISSSDLDDAHQGLMSLDSKTKQKDHKDSRLELVETLTNGVRARGFYSKFDYEVLKQIQENLEKALKVKEAEYLERQAQEQKRIELAETVSDLLKGTGFKLEDLVGAVKEKPAVKKAVRKGGRSHPLKYGCEIFGQEYRWHGVGKPPKAFQCYMAKEGKVKEDLLLPESEWIEMTDELREQYKTIPKEFLAEADKLQAQFNDRI